jgi:hypothetical protein
MSSSIHQQHGREASLSQVDLLQEAADVLRRCTDTGAALQAHETQLTAAALASLGQHGSSKDQFSIQANGSICAAWADADKPLEQRSNAPATAAVQPDDAGVPSWAGRYVSGSLYASTISEAAVVAAAAAAFGTAQSDSQPEADRSPPRHSSPCKQQQLLRKSQHQLQQLQNPVQGSRARQHNSSSPTTRNVELGHVVPAWTVAAAPSQASSQQAAPQRCQIVSALHNKRLVGDSRSRPSSSSRVRSSGPRPAVAAAGVAVLAEHDKLLLQELTHDLAALLARKMLRQWQQHAADARIDRARARPMQRLLRWVGAGYHHVCVCSVLCRCSRSLFYLCMYWRQR